MYITHFICILMCTSLPMPLIAAMVVMCVQVPLLVVPCWASLFCFFLTCFVKNEIASTSKYAVPTKYRLGGVSRFFSWAHTNRFWVLIFFWQRQIWFQKDLYCTKSNVGSAFLLYRGARAQMSASTLGKYNRFKLPQYVTALHHVSSYCYGRF